MSSGGRHIVVTGAGGFIGTRLARRLLASPEFADDRMTLTDVRVPDAPEDARVRTVEGDLAFTDALDRALGERADIVFHLAGVLGGAAEADPALSRRVNVDAALNLLDRMKDAGQPPRLVFASSIAVYGPPLPDLIDDESVPVATMIYGAQKRMLEIAIETMSARGWIDGLAIRLPGIVARVDADARLKSAFLNTMFHDYAAGRPIVLPVSPGGTTWLISVSCCIDALIHAALLPGDRLGRRRAFNLPAQHLTIDGIIKALARAFPESRSDVRYVPDADLEAQFAAQPPLISAIADKLGFRHDGDTDTLVRLALPSVNWSTDLRRTNHDPEIAQIEIDPSRAEGFEAAVAKAEAYFRASPDCTEFGLHRSIEHSGRYRLIVGWTSVDAHMVAFRASPGFQSWRALASPFFSSPPAVEHVRQVVPSEPEP